MLPNSSSRDCASASCRSVSRSSRSSMVIHLHHKQKQKRRPVSGPPSLLPTNYVLPVEFEPYLNLARQHVLGRNTAGEHRAEVAVGLVRGLVDLVAAEVVVVQQIEGFEAQLDTSALADPRGLQQRRVQL